MKIERNQGFWSGALTKAGNGENESTGHVVHKSQWELNSESDAKGKVWVGK